VVNLRVHGTILAGLVRSLPQRVSPKTWASIVDDIAGWASPDKPLPEVVKRFVKVLKEKAPAWEGVAHALGLVESASRAVMKVLDDLGRGREGAGEPLRIVMEAITKWLGPGESCTCSGRVLSRLGTTSAVTRCFPSLCVQ
jgi:hypothetical protein